MNDDFREFLDKFDPDFLRCVEVADQAGAATLRAAERCDADPICVVYCLWANLTKLMHKSGWTDTEIVALVYRFTADASNIEDEDEE